MRTIRTKYASEALNQAVLLLDGDDVTKTVELKEPHYDLRTMFYTCPETDDLYDIDFMMVDDKRQYLGYLKREFKDLQEAVWKTLIQPRIFLFKNINYLDLCTFDWSAYTFDWSDVRLSGPPIGVQTVNEQGSEASQGDAPRGSGHHLSWDEKIKQELQKDDSVWDMLESKYKKR